MHYTFGSHYEEYLDCDDEQAQRDLIKDVNRDTFVHMRSTKWFNLQSSEGRQLILCHLMALLRWHDDHGTSHFHPAGNSPVGGDSDYPTEDGEDSEYDG